MIKKPESLIELENIKKYFPIRGGIISKVVSSVHAVDGVTFNIRKGETFGLVGESGCGKTTAGLSILNLLKPTSGKIYFQGRDILGMSQNEMKEIRRRMQIIFQDPYSSLNPKLKVRDIIGEPLIIHNACNRYERRDVVRYLSEKVGLSPEHANRYPHELSGGERQRVGIARALALRPRLIVADEPVSALDVSIQAQIINLLEDLQEEFQLSYILVSHDLSVVEHVCDDVAVMYLGRIVEMASYKELFTSPQHPYTQALLTAIPIADPHRRKKRITLKGEVPSPITPPAGCSFHPRCNLRIDVCTESVPELREIQNEHHVACHRV